MVFNSDSGTVAIEHKKYELLRLWLLGSWMAKQRNISFNLLNVVPARRELDIESRFSPHIQTGERTSFKRVTWEHIHSVAQEIIPDCGAREKLKKYFHGKTLGYSSSGKLQKAFRYE